MRFRITGVPPDANGLVTIATSAADHGSAVRIVEDWARKGVCEMTIRDAHGRDCTDAACTLSGGLGETVAFRESRED
jgi:hypothetical protein